MAKRKRSSKVAVPPAPPAPSRPGVDLAKLATALIGGALAFFFVFGWLQPAPIVLAPLVAGVIVGCLLRNRLASALAGAAVGLAGSLASLASYGEQSYIHAVQSAPAWANPDIPASLYTKTIYQMILANPVNTPGMVPVVLVGGVVLTAGVAFGAAHLTRDALKLTKRWVVGGVAAILCASFVFTVSSAGAEFIQGVSSEPPSGTYAFDPIIYMNTYYEMLKGTGYYDSIVTAAAGDSRLQKDNLVHDGKFYGWVLSASFIREPTAFYLWKYASPGDARGVVYLGAVLCGLLLFGVWWALEPMIGDAALLGPPLLAPYFLLMTVNFNIFFPDYWAALMIVGSMLLLFRRQFIGAIVLAFLAAVFRETTVPWLLILAAYSGWVWIRDRTSREWLVRMAVAGGLLVLFGLQFWLHLANGSAVISPTMQQTSPIAYYLTRMQSSFEWKVVQPTAYMMFPYGFFAFPGWLLWPFEFLGLWVVLRGDRHVRALALLFAGFWVAFCVVFGVSSSYWGQVFMPVTLLGCVMLVGGAEQFKALRRA